MFVVRAGPLCMLLVATGCARAVADAGGRDETPVRISGVVTVALEPTATTYRASGTGRGRNTAVITSKINGYVRSVPVRAGDAVTAGQTLAVLEADALDANVRGARAGLRQSQQARDEADNALQAATAEARLADVNLSRARNLYGERAMTRQEFDETETRRQRAAAARQAASARLHRAQAAIDQAQAEVAAAQAGLANARIVAPFTGRVIERRVDPGSLATPGQPLLIVDERGPLRVDASVEESQAAHVHVGDAAAVTLEDLPRPVAGRVSEVVPAIDPASRAFIVKVELPALAGSGELRPGMFARVAFRTGTTRALHVPASAVVPAGALDRVFVIENGRARLRLVTVGDPDSDGVEVLSGLSPGDVVIAAPPPDLRDGQRVEVVS
jgi:multidrug efflux pump subunit AcrA (membrane-fusion protein)